MKKTTRRILLGVLIAVFLVSGGMMLRQLGDYRQGDETYGSAESLAGLPDFSAISWPESGGSGSAAAEDPAVPYVDPYADALAAMDFTALREVNSDVLGWILIPDTVVSYPLLQGSDNDYYLRRTWKKWSSAVGSIFLEAQNSPALTDFNTIIYGHNMNNGSMFGTLKKYKSQDYFRKHPYVYLTTDAGSARCEIFAAYEVSTDGDTYRLGFADDNDRQAFLDACCALSVIDTGVTPQVYDRIITLSTCTGRGHATRWVVQARLPGTPPETPEDPAPEAPPETQEDPAPETPPEDPSTEDPIDTPEDPAGPASSAPEGEEGS